MQRSLYIRQIKVQTQITHPLEFTKLTLAPRFINSTMIDSSRVKTAIDNGVKSSEFKVFLYNQK